MRKRYSADVVATLAPIDPDTLPIRAEPVNDEPHDEKPKPPVVSISEQLVRLALASYRFGRTAADEVFAVAKHGPNIAIMLKGSSEALRSKLAKEFRAMTKKTPSASAIADALNVLAGEALDNEAEPVHLRLASHDGGIVIDLGTADGKAVFVQPGSWKVLNRSPVLFRRTALTGTLPIPERGGKLDSLRQILNVDDDSWPLIVAFLIAAFMPDIPHVILLIGGLQGTGKSSAARVLVQLVDPSPAPLRSEPRDMDTWQIAAGGSWVVALDNLSGIPPWLADAFCRAATGDGLVKRTLYTNSDLSVISFRRVIILNSIDPGALRGDLGERLLFVDLEAIPETSRRTERELDDMFVGNRGKIFGAMLDAVAAVLKELPGVRPSRLPRMADFARILAAADKAGVTEGAFDGFLVQQGRISEEVIEADPFGAALAQFAHQREAWEGTAAELLSELLPAGTDKLPYGWPKRNGVKGRLKRLIPALKSLGIEIDFDREANIERRRLIRITSGNVPENIVQAVQKIGRLDDLDDPIHQHSSATPPADFSFLDDAFR